MKNAVKDELGNYKSEIVESIAEGGDLDWLNGRALDSLLEDARSTFDSTVDEIKNIDLEDVRNEIREDCDADAEDEARSTLGAEGAEFSSVEDEQFFNQLKERIVERLIKEKLSEYVERRLREII